MNTPMRDLLPVSSLSRATGDVPYRWRCSGCDQEFVFMRVPDPLSIDNPAYWVELGLVQMRFDQHWEKQHTLNESIQSPTEPVKAFVFNKTERLLSLLGKIHK